MVPLEARRDVNKFLVIFSGFAALLLLLVGCLNLLYPEASTFVHLAATYPSIAVVVISLYSIVNGNLSQRIVFAKAVGGLMMYGPAIWLAIAINVDGVRFSGAYPGFAGELFLAACIFVVGMALVVGPYGKK
jgi:hypothetical protein